MKLIQIIRHNEWANVQIALIETYPDEKKRLFAYERVYFKLKLLDLTASNGVIELKQVCQPNDEYIDVYALRGAEKKQWALDFVPWFEWLDMPISEKTVATFTELEIISHCLFEMTFYSFDEIKTQKTFSYLKKQADEISSKYS